MKNLVSIIDNAFRRRDSLSSESLTNVYRLFNSEGDGLTGLAIDRYNEFILLQIFDEDLASEHAAVSDAVVELIGSLPFVVKGVLYKRRDEIASAQREYLSDLVWGDLPSTPYTVIQSGVLVQVNLREGLNTGLFLDMRQVREKLSGYYDQLDSVLNLFCYTGIFSVHAIKGGVKHCTNVDISKTVLRRAKENYALNDISFDNRDFVAEDSGEYLKRLASRRKKFDLVVFDPPTFARNRNRTFSVKTDYPDYLQRIEQVSGKYVLSVINTYTVSDSEYISFHPRKWKMIEMMHESDDFPPGKDFYLKTGLWRI
ncbi:MAG TPA: class I SAM-dependent methyltransferase [Spirochaetota bacterium]